MLHRETTPNFPIYLAVAFFASTVLSCAAQELSVGDIVSRMVQAQAQSRKQTQAYIAERLYRVYKAENSNTNSEIMAEISFLPPGEKNFTIKKSSGGMAENVVRKALEHEANMARNPEISSVTPDNYDFQLMGQEPVNGNMCYVLKLIPKHEIKDLIKGRVWVDEKRFLIRRAEGKPAKNPSWWVKDVTVALEYNDVSGVWLQTASVATAKVRFAGDYTLNSQHLGLRRAEVSASAIEPAVRGAVSPSKRRVLRAEQGIASSVGFPSNRP